MSYPDRLIDKRVVARYIRKGMVDQAQYQSLIEALPDVEHNATTALEDDAPESDDSDEPTAPVEDTSSLPE